MMYLALHNTSGVTQADSGERKVHHKQHLQAEVGGAGIQHRHMHRALTHKAARLDFGRVALEQRLQRRLIRFAHHIPDRALLT